MNALDAAGELLDLVNINLVVADASLAHETSSGRLLFIIAISFLGPLAVVKLKAASRCARNGFRLRIISVDIRQHPGRDIARLGELIGLTVGQNRRDVKVVTCRARGIRVKVGSDEDANNVLGGDWRCTAAAEYIRNPRGDLLAAVLARNQNTDMP